MFSSRCLGHSVNPTAENVVHQRAQVSEAYSAFDTRLPANKSLPVVTGPQHPALLTGLLAVGVLVRGVGDMQTCALSKKAISPVSTPASSYS